MGVLYGEAQRLFIPRAPGSKGAPSSQAQALCYANTLSQISCLLHGQTQALPWELSGSCHSTVHLKPPPPSPQHTRRQSLFPNSMHNSTFFCKWTGGGRCRGCESSRWTLKVRFSFALCVSVSEKKKSVHKNYMVLSNVKNFFNCIEFLFLYLYNMFSGKSKIPNYKKKKIS